MKTVETIQDVRGEVSAARVAGQSVGLVPTMGALHAGHYSLVDRAASECDLVVVSIFVNPTQFGPGEDLGAYPRTLEADLAGCREHGAALVFAPGPAEMYPRQSATRVSVSGLDAVLCGASRPGHFAGVCTVVAKLFNIVAPDRAYFGAKDYQQVAIIRRMAEDLNFPVDIVTCPIVREADGLAMSSRNAYLSHAERAQAPALHQSLQIARELIERAHPPAAEVQATIRRHIAAAAPAGEIDYVAVVDPDTLEAVETTDRPVLIALAVRLGRARLIDNLRVG
jgi:pantoate--beta-alanine ligase